MKEAKKGRCQKCKNYFYVHDHHLLSQAIFGKGKTVRLCPNCRTHFHEFSKMQTTNENDPIEALDIWETWFKKIAVICSVALAVFLTFRFLF
jgi:hypothetical protein